MSRARRGSDGEASPTAMQTESVKTRPRQMGTETEAEQRKLAGAQERGPEGYDGAGTSAEAVRPGGSAGEARRGAEGIRTGNKRSVNYVR